MAGAWIAKVSLLGERSIKFILPEVTTHRRAHERVGVLTATGGCARSILRVLHRCVHGACLSSGGLGEHVRVVTRARLVVLDLRVLAVGHFREEDAGVALRIKCLLFLGHLLFSGVIGTGAGVVTRRELLVFDVNRWLKDLSHVLRGLEVTDWCSFLGCVDVRIVESWADGVLSTTCVHVLIDFLRGD